MMTTRNLVWMIMLFAIGTIFYGLAPMMARRDAVYRTYAPLVEVDALIRGRFVTDIDENRLIDGAIRGMLNDLDPYSEYIAPDEIDAFTRKHSQEYVGVGMELGLVAGNVTVITPLESSPASHAGVRPGDVIIAVNGKSAKETSLLEVDRLLAGRPGEDVSIVIQRESGVTEALTMSRAPVVRSLIEGIRQAADGQWEYIVDQRRRIAYIRIAHFAEGVSREFDRVLDELRRPSIGGLIIDVRSNPGGLMPEAIAIVNRFVDSGVILRTITRRQAVDTYVATEDGADTRTPIAVIINGGSASSSEIVAGCLQDRGRAVVVGERSFGKGSVQNLFQLASGGGVKLTVAHYQLPGGRIIHRTHQNVARDDWGVTPDIVVSRHDAAPGEHDPQLAAAIQALARLTP